MELPIELITWSCPLCNFPPLLVDDRFYYEHNGYVICPACNGKVYCILLCMAGGGNRLKRGF